MMVKGWRPWMPGKERAELDRHEAEKEARWAEFGLPTSTLYYDRDGDPMSFADWVEAFEDFNYRIVDKTMVGDFEVSTVWIGLDHSFVSDAPPLIFETMVFKLTGTSRESWDDKYMNRYSTIEQAHKGHEEAVVAVRADLIG